MNKINYIILALVLCFFISFMVLPPKTFAMMINGGGGGNGGTVPNFTQIETVPGLDSEVVMDEFLFGQTYIFIPPAEETTPPPPPPDDNDNDDNDNDNGNGTPPPPANGGGCTQEEPPEEPPADITDDDDVWTPPATDDDDVWTPPDDDWTPPPLPSPKYSCNKSTWTCYQNSNGIYSSLSRCQDACVEPPCMINYFEFLQQRAWVGYPITGKWSASDWCDDCDVDCTPYPECVWKQDGIGTGSDERKFTLEESGDYTYTLTCYKSGGRDQKQVTVNLEALNLPWWREIVPVLPGFLRGIWRQHK